MYSNPTMPSGSTSNTSANVPNEIRTTVRALANPHMSARSTYHERVRSNQSVNASIGFHGFQRDTNDQCAASDGVIVNEINSDVSVATATTNPNSRKNSPTAPGKNEIGKKTTTSTSVMTKAAVPISERPR